MGSKHTRLTEVFAAAPAPSAPTAAQERPNVPPSRRGKRAATVYLDAAAHHQLRALALAQGLSTQALLTAACNDLFQRYDMPRIA